MTSFTHSIYCFYKSTFFRLTFNVFTGDEGASVVSDSNYHSLYSTEKDQVYTHTNDGSTLKLFVMDQLPADDWTITFQVKALPQTDTNARTLILAGDGKYSKRRERASRNGSTAVDISMTPLSNLFHCLCHVSPLF